MPPGNCWQCRADGGNDAGLTGPVTHDGNCENKEVIYKNIVGSVVRGRCRLECP
jgi:hypothetical protein